MVTFLFWDCNFKQTLVDELVIVFFVFASSVIYVHLQREKRELERASDECESLGCILLTDQSGILPSTLGQSVLQVFCLVSWLAITAATGMLTYKLDPNELSRAQHVHP
jgi:hypothetical protein